ncbi:hypothetical protein D3C75_1154690 [compost metagenome]
MTIHTNKAFNVRVTFDEAGKASIGFVHGFYDVDSECYDIRPVSEDVKASVAQALGIFEASDFTLNKKLQKLVKCA